MIVSALLASLHYLALALGFWSIMERGSAFRSLQKGGDTEVKLKRLFQTDNVWGGAALLWIGTGFLRAFGGYEKGSSFYLSSPLFWVKMGLFLSLFLLETFPMIMLIRWRILRKRKEALQYSPVLLQRLFLLNSLEVVLIVAIVFSAGLMARGIGR